MKKEDLMKKLTDVEDLIVGLYGSVKPTECETILMAADGLVSVKTEIEAYYRYVPEGA